MTMLWFYPVILLTFSGQSLGLCIFGEGPDCFMKCHCQDEEPCDKLTGECTSGCAMGYPPSYGDWQAEGCQLMNVAYKKGTFSNTVINGNSPNYNKPHLWFNTNYTTDGSAQLQVFSGSCTVVYTDAKDILPWLMVDLKQQYIIPKVVLMNTDNSIDSSYLETFYIKIGNSSNITEQVVCKKYSGRVGTGRAETIECEESVIGRFVTIEKYEERNKVGRLPLCEILVFSYEAIAVNWAQCEQKSEYAMFCKRCNGRQPPDCVKDCPVNSYGAYCEGVCGKCKGGAQCDHASGNCELCELGWLPPLCQLPCPPNTWGSMCDHRCGRCVNGTQCDLATGTCKLGCALWYSNEDTTCNTYIPLIDIQPQLKILFIKDTWAMLKADNEINNNIKQYYKIKAFYQHESNPYSNLREWENIRSKINNDSILIEIDGMQRSSQYWFTFRIFRQQQGHLEGGEKSEAIKIFTLSKRDDNDQDQHLGSNNGNLHPINVSAPINNSLQDSNVSHTSNVLVYVLVAIIVIIIIVAAVIILYLHRRSQTPLKEGSVEYSSRDNSVHGPEDLYASSDPYDVTDKDQII